MTATVKAKSVFLLAALLVVACSPRSNSTISGTPSNASTGAATGAASGASTAAQSTTNAVFRLNAPLGLDLNSVTYYVPEDNALTEAKLKLGRRLFFDPFLSSDATVSCASCHVPDKGFADPNQLSIGVRGQKGARQAPTLINRVFSKTQFWDGRAASLEEQALIPITNPVEMGNRSLKPIIQRLKERSGYREDFAAAFPDEPEINARNLAKAIAAFERTILSGNSPFDHFTNGDTSALSPSATRGYRLFLGKANCAACHTPFNFTDEIFHNLGVGTENKKPDLGRFAISKVEGQQGAFKTPTLRDLTKTAPYMSNGSLKTLEEVIEYYDKGCQPNPWLSPKIKALNLTAEEKRDLIEFLKSLTGEITFYGKSDESKRAGNIPLQPRS